MTETYISTLINVNQVHIPLLSLLFYQICRKQENRVTAQKNSKDHKFPSEIYSMLFEKSGTKVVPQLDFKANVVYDIHCAGGCLDNAFTNENFPVHDLVAALKENDDGFYVLRFWDTDYLYSEQVCESWFSQCCTLHYVHTEDAA